MCGAKCVPSQGRTDGDARRARRSAPVRRFRARVCARRCKSRRFAIMRLSLSGVFGDFHFSEGGIGEFPCVFVQFRKVSAQSAPRALRTGVKGGINSPRGARRARRGGSGTRYQATCSRERRLTRSKRLCGDCRFLARPDPGHIMPRDARPPAVLVDGDPLPDLPHRSTSILNGLHPVQDQLGIARAEGKRNHPVRLGWYVEEVERGDTLDNER